jgi:hypothetical protein
MLFRISLPHRTTRVHYCCSDYNPGWYRSRKLFIVWEVAIAKDGRDNAVLECLLHSTAGETIHSTATTVAVGEWSSAARRMVEIIESTC